MKTAEDYEREFEQAAAAVQAKQTGRGALRVVARADHVERESYLDPLDEPLDRPAQPCRPFAWIEESRLPKREWLYGRHYIRKFVSATFAPGGVGKSSLALVEALAMVSGKPLLGVPAHPRGPFRVAYWSGEDPNQENALRVMATALHHGLTRDDLGEEWFEEVDIYGEPCSGYERPRLLLGSGREAPVILAKQTASGIEILAPNVEVVEEMIRDYQLDVVIIDPFVSSHQVSENDNNAIDTVVKEWARIADRHNISVELVHHTRKTNGAETTVEDGRGAVSLLAATRAARVLNVMTKDEAERAGVENPHEYFRSDGGKANMSPRTDKATWHRIVSRRIRNGDEDAGDDYYVGDTWVR